MRNSTFKNSTFKNGTSNKLSRNNRGTSTYTPMANTKATEQRFNIAEKYGHITVVSASVNLLISFTVRQLFIMSNKKGDFEKISKWADNTIEKIKEIRNSIRECMETTAYDYPTSSSAKVFGCKLRLDSNNDSYPHSMWYNSANMVPPHVAEENTMILVDAGLHHLLDQLLFRFNLAARKLDWRKSCEHDCHVGDDLKRMSNQLLVFLNEAIPIVEEHERLMEKVRTQYRQIYTTPRSNKFIKKETPSAPIKQRPPPIKRNLEPRNLMNDFTYASVLRGDNEVRKKETQKPQRSPRPQKSPRLKKSPRLSKSRSPTSPCDNSKVVFIDADKEISDSLSSGVVNINLEEPTGAVALTATEETSFEDKNNNNDDFEDIEKVAESVDNKIGNTKLNGDQDLIPIQLKMIIDGKEKNITAFFPRMSTWN